MAQINILVTLTELYSEKSLLVGQYTLLLRRQRSFTDIVRQIVLKKKKLLCSTVPFQSSFKVHKVHRLETHSQLMHFHPPFQREKRGEQIKQEDL